IEHHERLFTENNSSNKGRMKADIVGVRLSDNRQVVFLKMSGAPTDFLNVHTMGDTYKKVQERVDSLNSVLLNFLNYDVRYAKKILSKGSVRDRLTLRSIFLRGKDDYADEEEFSAVFPLSWEFLLGF
ncbi:19881_t:CDS:2, partial [Rhizophagus irregularis]